MTKKFAMVKELTNFGTIVSIMNERDFNTCQHKCCVMFESDIYKEVDDKYRNYKNKQEEIIHV